jgi:hypothetical protein
VAVHISENLVHHDGGSPYWGLPQAEPATTGMGWSASAAATVAAARAFTTGKTTFPETAREPRLLRLET